MSSIIGFAEKAERERKKKKIKLKKGNRSLSHPIDFICEEGHKRIMRKRVGDYDLCCVRVEATFPKKKVNRKIDTIFLVQIPKLVVVFENPGNTFLLLTCIINIDDNKQKFRFVIR